MHIAIGCYPILGLTLRFLSATTPRCKMLSNCVYSLLNRGGTGRPYVRGEPASLCPEYAPHKNGKFCETSAPRATTPSIPSIITNKAYKTPTTTTAKETAATTASTTCSDCDSEIAETAGSCSHGLRIMIIVTSFVLSFFLAWFEILAETNINWLYILSTYSWDELVRKEGFVCLIKKFDLTKMVENCNYPTCITYFV